MSKKLKHGILAIVAIVLIGFALKGKFTHETFNANKWQNAAFRLEENWSLRWDMMNSLRNNYQLKGMSKNQILELLGEPESKTENEFAYYLGYSKPRINTGRLTIKFENGKVTAFSVWDG